MIVLVPLTGQTSYHGRTSLWNWLNSLRLQGRYYLFMTATAPIYQSVFLNFFLNTTLSYTHYHITIAHIWKDTAASCDYFSSFRHCLCNAAKSCSTAMNERAYDVLDFFALSSYAFKEIFTPKLLKSEFRRAGHWPLDPYRILIRRTSSSYIENRSYNSFRS